MGPFSGSNLTREFLECMTLAMHFGTFHFTPTPHIQVCCTSQNCGNHNKWHIIVKRNNRAFQWYQMQGKWVGNKREIVSQTWVSELFLRSLVPFQSVIPFNIFTATVVLVPLCWIPSASALYTTANDPLPMMPKEMKFVPGKFSRVASAGLVLVGPALVSGWSINTNKFNKCAFKTACSRNITLSRFLCHLFQLGPNNVGGKIQRRENTALGNKTHIIIVLKKQSQSQWDSNLVPQRWRARTDATPIWSPIRPLRHQYLCKFLPVLGKLLWTSIATAPWPSYAYIAADGYSQHHNDNDDDSKNSDDCCGGTVLTWGIK